MFFKKIKEIETKEKITELENKITRLTNEKKVLQEDVENLKLKKKIEDEDIKHMVKMKEERLTLQFEKKVVQASKEKAETVAKIQNDYRDKVEANLEVQIANMKDMYNKILERLPIIKVNLNGEDE